MSQLIKLLNDERVQYIIIAILVYLYYKVIYELLENS